jgi:hypothetical protein
VLSQENRTSSSYPLPWQILIEVSSHVSVEVRWSTILLEVKSIIPKKCMNCR